MNILKNSLWTASTLALLVAVSGVAAPAQVPIRTQSGSPLAGPQPPAGRPPMSPAPPISTVYFSRNMTPETLLALYKVMGRDLPGKVAVKLHSGEPGGNNYLKPELIKPLVQQVKGTVVECNTAYGLGRAETKAHEQVMKDHGFASIAPIDIMDAEGSINLPVPRGAHLKYDMVGSHFSNYDSFLVLSHFKGHRMGGFGGALKNISIGIASSSGKMWIHTAGSTDQVSNFHMAFSTNQNAFVESMAEAASAVTAKLGKNIVFISVMNNLSIDCDCSPNPAKPEMDDIGILASTDPVALDRACVDMIHKADAVKSAALRARMEAQHGTVILEHAEAIGMGTQRYNLVTID